MDKENCDVLLKYLDQIQLYADHLCKADLMQVQDHVKFTSNNEVSRKQIESLMDNQPKEPEQIE